jgi:hypothetical protein
MISFMIKAQGFFQVIIADDLTLGKDKPSNAELLQQSIGVTGKNQCAGRLDKLLHSLLCLREETAVSSSEAFVKGEAFMRSRGEQGKKEPSRHALAVAFHWQMHKISKARKFCYCPDKLWKSSEVTIHQKVVGFGCLHSAEFWAGDEAFVNHRKYGNPGLEIA